jgi:hypothetical protein
VDKFCEALQLIDKWRESVRVFSDAETHADPNTQSCY